MKRENVSTLCRICLESGAKYLIFEEEDRIYSKLRECLKENVEDIEGYPRHICVTCKDTLDVVHSFMCKFRESLKLLKDGVLNLKQEINDDNSSDFETNQLPETEIELKSIKPESRIFLETTEDLIDFLEPLENEPIEEKKSTIKVEKSYLKTRKFELNKTSRLATSILEGEFVWTGETWCLKSTVIKEPKIKVEGKPRRRNTRLKLPKKQTVKQPKLCDVCGATFKTQNRLNGHRKRVHFNKPTQCSLCPRLCSSEKNLLSHIKRKHNANKEHVCAVCGNGFAFKGELNSHITKMHKNRPKPTFACKFCDKIYSSQKSAIIHERSAHTGERPAECSVCSKSFFHEEYLKEHMRLHTGEAPYKCPVCDRGYAQRGNMKSHLRIHRITEVDASTLSKMKPNYIKLLKN